MQVTHTKAAGLLAGLLLALVAPALAHDEGCAADAALHRPEIEAPLPHAAGGVVARIGDTCESLQVIVREVSNEVALSVTLYGAGHAFEMGDVPGSEDGPRKLTRYSCEGDTLPGDVESVRDLFGYEIVVRNGEGEVVLFGHVPEVECHHDGDGDGDGDGEGDGHHEPETHHGNAALRPPEGTHETERHGGIGAWQRGDREKFVLELGGFAPDSSAFFFVGNGEDGFTLVDDLAIGGEGGARFFRDTGEGQQLPLGLTLAQLAGRPVEIRNGDGGVLLVGHIPELNVSRPEETEKSRAPLTRPDGAPHGDAHGVVGVWRRGEREKFDVEVGGVGREVGLLLYIANADGTFELVGDMRTGEHGGAELMRTNFEHGELPLGVDSLDELAGRGLEIRNLDGDVVLAGDVPAFETADEGNVRERETHRDALSGAKVGVRVRIHVPKGRERLVFDMRNLPRDAAAKRRGDGRGEVHLFIADDLGQLIDVASAPIRRGGSARIRWTTQRGDALPLDVATIRDLSGRAYEIRVGDSPVADGFIPFF